MSASVRLIAFWRDPNRRDRPTHCFALNELDSSSRRNRVRASQKSYRTITMHLHVSTVALPQGLDQLLIRTYHLGMQPLLELIDDEEYFCADRDAWPSHREVSESCRLREGGKPGQGLRRALTAHAICLLGRGPTYRATTCGDKRGSKPGLKSDDLPQPLGK